MGICQLKAGQPDPQKPHGEDEVYYVVAGNARFRADGGTAEVKPGTILFVPKGEQHRFEEITADLTVLVVFAPPEGSRPSAG